MENNMHLNENELKAAAGGAQHTIVGSTDYVVQRGECLDTIARKNYMSGWQELYSFMDNSRRIGPNPNVLQVGMILKVPVYLMG